MREGGVKLAGSRGEKKAAQCRPCRGGKKTHARTHVHGTIRGSGGGCERMLAGRGGVCVCVFARVCDCGLVPSATPLAAPVAARAAFTA